MSTLAKANIRYLVPGEDAISYWITCSPDQLKRDADGNLSTTSLSVSVMKAEGKTITVANDVVLAYNIYSDNTSLANGRSSNFTIDLSSENVRDNVTRIELSAGKGGITVATKTINVVVDGAKGEVIEPWSVECDTRLINTNKDIPRTFSINFKVRRGTEYLPLISDGTTGYKIPNNQYPRVSFTAVVTCDSGISNEERTNIISRFSINSTVPNSDYKDLIYTIGYTTGETDVNVYITFYIIYHKTSDDYESQILKIPFNTFSNNKAAKPRTTRWKDLPINPPYLFLPGTNGDEYFDVTEFEGKYYECTARHTKLYNTENPKTAVELKHNTWVEAKYWKFIASDLIFTERAKVDNLFVDDIDITDDNGVRYFYANKDGLVCKKGTFENVKIISGTSEGARLELNTKDSSGGMVIYDSNNIEVARYSADVVTNPTNVFAGTSTNGIFSIGDLSVEIADRIPSLPSGGNQDALIYTDTFRSTVQTTSLSTVTFNTGSETMVTFNHLLDLSISAAWHPDKQLGQDAECMVNIYFNGVSIKEVHLSCGHGVGYPKRTFKTIHLKGGFLAVKGDNTLSVKLMLADYDCTAEGGGRGQATLTVGNVAFTAEAPKRIARYFANGIVIGTSDQSYFATYIDGSETEHVMRAGNYGIKVDKYGLYSVDQLSGEWVPFSTGGGSQGNTEWFNDWLRGFVVDETGNNENKVMSQKAVTEELEKLSLSENALETFDRTYITDEQIADAGNDLFKVIQDRIDAGYTYIDLRSLNTGETYHVTGYGRQPFDKDGTPLKDANGEAIRGALVIDRPCEIVFNVGVIEYSGPHHMIIFACDGCKLTGHNRMGRTNDPEGGSTILKMTNNGASNFYSSGSGYHYNMPKYHIYCRGYNNMYVQNLTLRGIRSSIGAQYGSWSNKLLGCGGIYFEKPNPAQISSGNTLNNCQIVNVAVFDTVAHGIYLDTPILSNLRNVRVSGAGGFGVFVRNGTTMTLDTVFVTSANYGGFMIFGLVYLNLLNCASENSGVGYWLRSCQNVTAYSPGSEELVNRGNNIWSSAQTDNVNGRIYGLGLYTTGGLDTNGGTDDRGQRIRINDVPSDYYTRFTGTAFLITGGSNITLMTPYATTVGTPPDGGSFSANTYFMRVDGNCRGLYVLNPGFHFNSAVLSSWHSAGKMPLIKNEIYLSSSITGATIYYNVDQLNCLKDLCNTFGSSYGTITDMVTYENKVAPIRITRGGDVEIKAGNRYFTVDGVRNILYREAAEVTTPVEIDGFDLSVDTTTGTLHVMFNASTSGVLQRLRVIYRSTLFGKEDYLAAASMTYVTPTAGANDTYTASLTLPTGTTYFAVYGVATNVAGTIETKTISDIFSATRDGEIVNVSTGEGISSAEFRMTATLLSYESATNIYTIRFTWVNYTGELDEAGAAYSITNATPTVSQNKKAGTISGTSCEVSIQGSASGRYVRFYLYDESAGTTNAQRYTYSDVYRLENGELNLYST